MDFEVTGKLQTIKPIITGTKKDGSGEWQKVEFVLSTTDEYNNIYAFEVFGDKVQNFVKYNKEGNSVSVKFNGRCNEWQGKHFTTLQAWHVQNLDKDQQGQGQAPAPELIDNDIIDPLPF